MVMFSFQLLLLLEFPVLYNKTKNFSFSKTKTTYDFIIGLKSSIGLRNNDAPHL